MNLPPPGPSDSRGALPGDAPIPLGLAHIHPVTLATAVECVSGWAQQRGRPHLVVTPNVANIAVLQREAAVQAAYAQADLVLADGWPVALAVSLIARRRVPRVTGSDLLPALAARRGPRLRAVLIGGRDPGKVATAVAGSPGLVVVDAHGGRWRPDQSAAAAVHEICARNRPDVLLLALGSPKQEALAAAALQVPGLDCGVILCLGAAGDFVSGDQVRAPRWAQRLGLEWAHRLLSDPRRLGPRYLAAIGPFTGVALRALWHSPRERRSERGW